MSIPMKRPLALLLFAAALVAGARELSAHHAFGAEFDPNAPIRLQGKVVKLEWVNPHSWIHIEIKNKAGGTEVWMVEGGTPNTLLRRGLTRESLKYGTELIVDGYQTKDHSLKRRSRHAPGCAGVAAPEVVNGPIAASQGVSSELARAHVDDAHG